MMEMIRNTFCGKRLLGGLLSIGLAVALLGCSDDGTTDAGDDDPPVFMDYLLLGYLGGDVAPQGFGLQITRLDPGDLSAMAADVTLNGDEVPLVALGSSPSEATYATLAADYQAGETYTIIVSIGSRTSVCTFTGLAYPVLTLTSPAEGHEFFPTEPIQLAWEYDGGAPAHVYVEAIGDDDEVLLGPLMLAGETTSYTIPGSLTAGWGGQSQILITVDEGEALFPFTGDLAGEGSGVTTVGWGDAAIVTPGEGDPACTIEIALGAEELPADGESEFELTCTLGTAGGGTCPDGTTVSFSCEPEGAVSFDPEVASSASNLATTTVTAGTSPGEVTLRAELADGTRAEAALTLAQAFTFTIGSGAYPTIEWSPALPMFSLTVGEAGDVFTLLTWQITATAIGQITPPVTYGTVPAGATQFIPIGGSPPSGLAAGTSYRIILIDSHANTVTYRFTHGG